MTCVHGRKLFQHYTWFVMNRRRRGSRGEFRNGTNQRALSSRHVHRGGKGRGGNSNRRSETFRGNRARTRGPRNRYNHGRHINRLTICNCMLKQKPFKCVYARIILIFIWLNYEHDRSVEECKQRRLKVDLNNLS